MVVGMDGAPGAQLSPEDLDGAVGDHLVGVHVGGGARPGLEHVEDEGVVQTTIDDLPGGLHDGVPLLIAYEAELVVYDGGLELYGAERFDEAARLAQVAYGKVIEGAAGVGSPMGVRACRRPP